MEIKTKYFESELNKIHYIDKGDWIDLYTAKTVEFNAPIANRLSKNNTIRNVEFDFKIIPLDIAVKLPDGYEAVVLPRSSTFKKQGILLANSQGVIDNSYCGDNDQWGFPAIAFRKTIIYEGTRIAQFRVQLSQKATIWQKLRWLFSNRIPIKYHSVLEQENRGGFGTTGDM